MEFFDGNEISLLRCIVQVLCRRNTDAGYGAERNADLVVLYQIFCRMGVEQVDRQEFTATAEHLIDDKQRIQQVGFLFGAFVALFFQFLDFCTDCLFSLERKNCVKVVTTGTEVNRIICQRMVQLEPSQLMAAVT